MDPDKRTLKARLQACLAAACTSGRSRMRADRGSVLIEVMVGAMVLAIATVAILNGIDGAQSAGAKNKARSVQATLAQQDIERMRSMPVSTLDNFSQTRLVNVAGVDYTVVSRTDWVSDRAGTVACSDTRAQADYLKLTSSVTSPATRAAAVTETGLLTPTVGQLSNTSGTATVQLTDRDGMPLSGFAVTLTGTSSQSATANSLGCAVFGYIPSGTYTVRVGGLVTTDSSSPATSTIQVYPGRATFHSLQVDRPAVVRALFVPPTGQTNTTSMVWDVITVKNASLIGGQKEFVRTAGRSTSVDAPDLYPFLDGVGVYAGDCAANDPSLYAPNYFNPSATRGFTLLSPGVQSNVNVEMPALRVTVYRSNLTTNFVSAQLKLTPLDSGCTATATASASFAGKRPHIFDVAVPFGRYTVCASTRTSGGSPRKVTSTQDLRTPVPATPNRSLTLTTGSTTGDCLP
jgi:Tfp pilus assembly protein PilV